MRYERQLGRSLFANFGLAYRRTEAGFAGQNLTRRAPYEPAALGSIGLNYIDPSGNKVGLVLRRTGSFFQDSPGFTERARFPAHTYVDLRLAREASVQNELFVDIRNVFDSPEIDFNGFPSPGRRVDFGVTRRF